MLIQRSQLKMPSTIKTSRRLRIVLWVLAASTCVYMLRDSLRSFQVHSSINTLEQHENPVETLSAKRYKQHVDNQIFVSSEVNSQNEDYPHAKIGKITMLYGDGFRNPIYDRVLLSHENHARVHHYPLFILRQKLLGRLWSKPAYIMSIIVRELEKPNPKDRLEWLFWFDADTFLLNQKIPLELFLPPKPHINFMCGKDHNGLNTGSFFMRVNEWTLHLMAAAISLEDLRPEVDLKYSEQSAIDHLVTHEPRYVSHTAIVPQRWYNALMGPREWDGSMKPKKQITGNSVQEGDLQVHFAGSDDTRKARMTKFINAFEKDPSRWELDVEEVEILEEMKEFWESWAVSLRKKEEKGLPRLTSNRKNLGVGSDGSHRSAQESRADHAANATARGRQEERSGRRPQKF